MPVTLIHLHPGRSQSNIVHRETGNRLCVWREDLRRRERNAVQSRTSQHVLPTQRKDREADERVREKERREREV